VQVHPTAIISSQAEIGPDVFIGPYCIIGDHVTIGRGTRLIANVIIEGPTEIGEECQFYPFSSIGFAPQDLKFRGEDSWLRIGNKNIFREYVTINRGTTGGGSVTRIADENFFMAYTHIAHDCQIGSHVIMGNAVTLAGHVAIHDHAIIGAFTGFHQFCRAGTHAFIGGYSVITRDALPYVKTVGSRNEAKTYGINAVGLERKGFSAETIADLNKAYRVLFRSKLNTSAALAKLEEAHLSSTEVGILVDFIQTCERGFVK
jgi:UDP-N-acetylglucosamine acyltransferase